jgi:deoxyribodipyrimidine photolyase
MKRLVITNNYCFLPKLADCYQELIFCPPEHSLAQSDFQSLRYLQLKKLYPSLMKRFPKKGQNNDYLSWNATNELNASNNKVLPFQNRLFQSLPFPVGEGFTPFRKKAEIQLPNFFKEAYPPTDEEVLTRLSYFFDQQKLASTYFETRNGLVGQDYSTQLSPFLACGALDVRYLYNYIKNYENTVGSNKSTYWLIFELLWREYFYWHYQKHQSLYFSSNGIQGPKKFEAVESFSF